LQFLSDNGYFYNWSVRVNDSDGFSSWTSEWNISIASFVDITLLVDAITFGQIGYLGTNDTGDDSPSPFVLENSGNVFANITVGATDLWSTQVNPNSYYQFKADNYSEVNSFNWLTSLVVYTDMVSNNTPLLGIAELNYSDATDTAEVDINITVPSNEGSGVRNSVVTFTGSLAE
jgi:hypothetical protein